MLSIALVWAHDVEIDGIYYNLDEINKTAEVTHRGEYYYSYDEYSGSVTIPYFITYKSETYNVTSIGSSAFGNCVDLTLVTIPTSIVSIGSNAFYNTAIYNNSSNWENGVLYIGDYLIKATELVGLGNYSIKEGTRVIANDAFSGCTSLSSIKIPNSVTSIGSQAFYACSGLISVTIGNSVTSIGELAFYACRGLASVTIPNSVTSIESYAFRDCSALTSVSIGNSVKSIGAKVFYNCSDLNSVAIGYSVASIGEETFYGTNIYNNTSNWIDGVLYIDNCLIKAQSDVKENYVIKEGTRVIADYAFKSSNITSITIPNSVISIGNNAFEYCYDLTSITIGNRVTLIGDYAFSYCDSLEFITIPNSVTSIGYQAFCNCSNLTSVTIGNSVNSISPMAFQGCISLKEFIVSIDNKNYSSEKGVLFNKDKTELVRYPMGKEDTSYIIPNSVKFIGPSAFIGSTSLTSITISNNVTSIFAYAFGDCNNLTSIVWNAKNFNDVSFYYKYRTSPFYYISSQITYFKFGKEVEYIPSYLCSEMSNLKEIIIPNSVNSIGEGVFNGCDELMKIIVYPTTKPAVYENSFAHYDATLYVLCDVYDDYFYDEVFGNFKVIECVTSEDVDDPEKPEEGGGSEEGGDKETFVEESLANVNITVSEGTISCPDSDFIIYNIIGLNVTALNGSLTPGVYVVQVGEDIAKVMVK